MDLGTLMSKRGCTSSARRCARGRTPSGRRSWQAVGREVWPWIPDKVRPVIHGTVPFDDAQAAHDLMRVSGEVFGKIVLVP